MEAGLEVAMTFGGFLWLIFEKRRKVAGRVKHPPQSRNTGWPHHGWPQICHSMDPNVFMPLEKRDNTQGGEGSFIWRFLMKC